MTTTSNKESKEQYTFVPEWEAKTYKVYVADGLSENRPEIVSKAWYLWCKLRYWRYVNTGHGFLVQVNRYTKGVESMFVDDKVKKWERL